MSEAPTLHFVPDVETAKAKVAEFRGEVTELVLAVDWMGCTALHAAMNVETARFLLNSVPPKHKKLLVWSRDWLDHTPLHYARNREVAQLLIDYLPRDDYIMYTNWFMRTALHEAWQLDIVKVLVTSISQENRVKFILKTDWKGKNAIDEAIRRGLDGIAKYLQSFLDEEQQLNYIDELQRLEYNQLCCGLRNVSHVAKRCLRRDKLLLPDFDRADLVKPGGACKNPIISYVIATQQIELVAKFLQIFTIEERQVMLGAPNIYQATGMTIACTPPSQLHPNFNRLLDENLWPGFVKTLKFFKDWNTINIDMVRVLSNLCQEKVLTAPGAVVEFNMANKIVKQYKKHQNEELVVSASIRVTLCIVNLLYVFSS